MSTSVNEGDAPVPGGPRVGGAAAAGTPRYAGTTPAGRLRALGRAELTLLMRNKSALFVSLVVPAAMILAIRASLSQLDVGEAGLSLAEAALTGGIGMVLVTAVYLNLSAAYTARREDLVLKRLRTVEASDAEILAGTALPSVALALAQCAVFVTVGVTVLGIGAPERPLLLAAGVLGGLALLTALAAATSALTRTVESAQITTMPLYLISVAGSGLFFPVDLLPERIAAACGLLPMTGVMTLIRAGWLGGVGGRDLLVAALSALVWLVAAVFAVRRWFRWEARR